MWHTRALARSVPQRRRQVQSAELTAALVVGAIAGAFVSEKAFGEATTSRASRGSCYSALTALWRDASFVGTIICVSLAVRGDAATLDTLATMMIVGVAISGCVPRWRRDRRLGPDARDGSGIVPRRRDRLCGSHFLCWVSAGPEQGGGGGNGLNKDGVAAGVAAISSQVIAGHRHAVLVKRASRLGDLGQEERRLVEALRLHDRARRGARSSALSREPRSRRADRRRYGVA